MTVSDRLNRPASAVVELRTTLSHLDGGRARSGSTQDIDVPSVLCVVSASSRLHLAFIPTLASIMQTKVTLADRFSLYALESLSVSPHLREVTIQPHISKAGRSMSRAKGSFFSHVTF